MCAISARQTVVETAYKVEQYAKKLANGEPVDPDFATKPCFPFGDDDDILLHLPKAKDGSEVTLRLRPKTYRAYVYTNNDGDHATYTISESAHGILECAYDEEV